MHSDNGVLGAATIGRADERRVELLKEAGFNALRSAHNPMSRAMLDACDRLGVLVMDELTDVWTESKSDFDAALDFPEWWEREVEAMVAKDVNHPSVVFYSIGNEIPEVGEAARRGVVAAAGREGPRAGRHSVRHQRDQRDARRDRRGESGAGPGGHQHDAHRHGRLHGRAVGVRAGGDAHRRGLRRAATLPA